MEKAPLHTKDTDSSLAVGQAEPEKSVGPAQEEARAKELRLIKHRETLR